MMWYHLLFLLLYREARPETTWFNEHTVIQQHATEIANIALSEIPSCVRGFSALPLFFGTFSRCSTKMKGPVKLNINASSRETYRRHWQKNKALGVAE